ncbi:MAG TPA: hypothetical protein V6C58_22870 [Allocoleopsis sp.]
MTEHNKQDRLQADQAFAQCLNQLEDILLSDKSKISPPKSESKSDRQDNISDSLLNFDDEILEELEELIVND